MAQGINDTHNTENLLPARKSPPGSRMLPTFPITVSLTFSITSLNAFERTPPPARHVQINIGTMSVLHINFTSLLDERVNMNQWRFWGLHFGGRGQWGGHNCSWGHGPILPQ